MNEALSSIIEHPPVFEDLGKMAAKLVYYNYEWRYFTLVLIQTAHVLIPLQTFLLEYKQSVVIKMGKFIAYNRPASQFVIFGENSKEIVGTLLWLSDNDYNSGKYIIVCSATDYENCEEKEVFEVLSANNIVNVLFLMADTDNSSLTFSYEKIIPEECNNKVPDVIGDVHVGCSNDDCFKSKFLPKYKNFYKCPFAVSTFEQLPFMHLDQDTKHISGEDGSLVNLITSSLNASLVVKIPESGYWGHYENNNWTGSLGQVYNGQVDVSVCSLPISVGMYGNFQISFVYNSMDMVWSAKLPNLQPSYEKLVHPFKMLTRVVILLVFMGIVLVSMFIRTGLWDRIRKSFNIGPPKSSLLFYSWALFLGLPILQFPSNRHVVVIVCTWIWFCFIVRSCYQAALINSLKHHDYEDYLANFNKVLQNKYPFGGHSSLREYYADDDYVYNNWVNLEVREVFEKLLEISSGVSDFVVAYNKEVVKDYMFRSNGSRNLQIIPEKIVNSPTVMYFKRHSPLVARVNDILSRSVEAGLTKIVQERNAVYINDFFKHLHEEKTLPITLDHITACMYVLVFGWFLSIIFFIVEVYFGRLK